MASRPSQDLGSEEDKNSLFLWQRAAFLESESGGRACADSLRMRLGQLEYAYWKEKNSALLIKNLMEGYLRCYGSVIDDKEGMNDFVAPVQVLTRGQKNESKDWKSNLTFESVMEMPEIKTLLNEDKFWEAQVDANTTSEAIQAGGSGMNSPPQRSAPVGVSVQKSPQSPYGVFRRSSSSGTGYPHSQQPSSSTRSVRERAACSSNSNTRDENQGVGRPPTSYWERPSCFDSGVGLRKRPRMELGMGGQDEEEEEGGTEKERKQLSAFVTARDQYVINQRRKFGHGAGSDGAGMASRQVTSGSYGTSKKSLGTRRAAGSRFVPPVKREDVAGEITSRALHKSYSGGSGGEGGGGSKLPPELEGNERLRNIEPRMVELILNEIMDHGAPVQWDDIAGLEFAKTSIKEIVVWPMLRPDIFTGLRGPPKGILLFGPPGTGKTLIGKCIASQVNATFFSISASSLTSKWIGEGEKMVRALFAVARCYQPAVIFIDEIDSLLSQRSNSEHESSRRIKTEFLVQLDGATTNADDRLLMIGATNRPQEIDEAARRRLVKRLYIPLPDGLARRQIVLNLMKQQSFSISEEEVEAICKQSDGYSGADMANLCREAAYGPVREAAESIQHIAADEMRPILYKDFLAAFDVIRPSVSDKDLCLYTEWNKQFGCGK